MPGKLCYVSKRIGCLGSPWHYWTDLTGLKSSTIRDIPDHQEVLLLKDGQCSIVLEIVERAAPPTHPCTTDMEALDYHYKDMTSNEYTNSDRNTGEITNVWHKDRVRLLGLCVLPSDPYKLHSLLLVPLPVFLMLLILHSKH